MTPDELHYLLQRYGVRSRIKGDEVIVESCFACGNERWNLELNAAKGVFNCWACSYSGRLDALLGDQFGVHDRIDVHIDKPARIRRKDDELGIPVLPVTEVPSARAYLASRGLSLSDIIRLRISVCVEKQHQWFGYIVFPLREYWTGRLMGSVGRVIPILGRYLPKYLQDVQVDALPGYRVDGAKAHAVVEGVFDALAVTRQNVNAAPMLGLAKAEQAVGWAALVPPDERVYIVLDAEAAREAQRLYWNIKPVHDNVTVIELPLGHDPGSYLTTTTGVPFLTA